jgi:hypothetical protein
MSCAFFVSVTSSWRAATRQGLGDEAFLPALTRIAPTVKPRYLTGGPTEKVILPLIIRLPFLVNQISISKFLSVVKIYP